MNDGFVTARVYPGKTNALVKNLMRQMGISDPNEAVRRMNAGEWVVHPIAQATKVLTIDRTTLFDPSAFIGKGHSIWRGPLEGDGLLGEEEQDARSLLLTEVDFTKVTFETALRDGDPVITGEEKLKRLVASGVIRLDDGIFLALWNDYQKNKAESVLESLRKEKRFTYLDFFGTILRDPNCHRCVLYLYHAAGEWRWRTGWLDHGWLADVRSVVLAS